MALRIENKAAQNTADIYLFDEIGESFFGGVTAKEMQQAIESVKNSKSITLHINSPGGDFFAGLAIYNTLKKYRDKLTTSVEGLAASAASFVALAGSRVEMAESSWIMIHDAHSVVAGNAAGLREMAEKLDGFSDTISAIYSDKTGKSKEEMRDAMRAETWLNASDAKAMGFIDEINSQLKVAAHYVEPDRFQRAPAEIIASTKEKAGALQKHKARAMVNRARLMRE
jgi:ATP-dependent Clp endopeptidase proteolytic subunit ClpP